MKKLVLLFLFLFLFGLTACDDKKASTPSVTVNESRETLAGDRSDKVSNEEISTLGKPNDSEPAVTTEEEEEENNAIEYHTPVITIPDPQPVEPPIVAETAEETTASE